MNFAPRVYAETDDQALRANFRALKKLAPSQELLCMVKADGYGHGAAWVANTLTTEKRLYGFGVATLEEGEILRQTVHRACATTPIHIFSGAAPWTHEKGERCVRQNLVPVLTSLEDFEAFTQQDWPGKLSYELKFNTGMNRLGISLSDLGSIEKTLRSLKPDARPIGVLSHLAQAENPRTTQSRGQLEKFMGLRERLSFLAPKTKFHLANSAALFHSKEWRLAELTQLARPGLALYGVQPSPDLKPPLLTPVMRVMAQVIATRNLRAGDAVGYGAKYKAKRATKIAILAAGYADGVHRMLSNEGKVFLGGRLERVVGMVSMDLCAVECGNTACSVGDYAEILGPRIDPWVQAKAAGTIPYELLTSLTARVGRVHELGHST